MEHQQQFPPSDFLRCFLCSKLYEDPKLLPCLHSFCTKCIAKEQFSRKKISCPLCRDSFEIGEKGLAENDYLKNRVYLYNQQQKDLVNPMCHFCKLRTQENKLAMCQCVTCLDLLCKECSEKHTSTTSTIDHQVVSIAEIKTGMYDDTILLVKFKSYCPKHPSEEMKYFCKTCNVLICSLCIIKDHKGHDLERVYNLIDEKENKTRALCQVLKDKASALCQGKDSLTYRRKELKKLEEKKIAEIKKSCSEAVSKIDRGKNKMLNELNDHLKAKSNDLERGINNISVHGKHITDAVQYTEHVLNGMGARKIFLFDELDGRLAEIEKNMRDSIPFNNFLEEMPYIGVSVAEPKLEMTFNKKEDPCKQTFKVSEDECLTSAEDDNSSSDFFYVCDKAVQTSEADFENLTASKDVQKRKYSIRLMKNLDLASQSDENQSYFTSVAWIDENQFVAVDAGNSKLKICSVPLGTILKSTQINKPLAVSAWKDGISCLTQWNTMLVFDSDLCLQNTLRKVSCLCPSLPNSDRFEWIENTTINKQKRNEVSKLPLEGLPPNSSPPFFRYACSHPKGFHVLSDMSNFCVYLVNKEGSIYETLNCNPGSVAFDKYYNIFIADFQNSVITIFDPTRNHLADLYLKQRPRSISILHDKLIVAAEFGSKVFLYDIIYR